MMEAFDYTCCEKRQLVPEGHLGFHVFTGPRDPLRVLGAPAEADTPLAALGELGAAVGDAGLLKDFLGQALAAYQAFTGKVVAAVVDGVAEAAVVGIKWLRFVTSPHAQRLRLGIPIAVTHKFIECEKNSQAVICLLLGLSTASRINSNKRRNGRSWRMFLFSMQCCIQIMHFAFCHFAL